MTYLNKLKSAIASKILKSDNVINLTSMRKNNIPYIFIWIIYYAWVVAFTTWWTSSPVTTEFLDESIRSMLHSVNLISSAIFVLIIKKEWFVKTAQIGSIVLIIGMVVFITARSAALGLVSAVVVGISIGFINISILMPFVFTLNNTEKFYAVVLSNILINILSLMQVNNVVETIHNKRDMLVSFAILIIALATILFFKRDDIPINKPSLHKDELNIIKIPSKAYLTVFFNCAFAILCKGAGKGILNITATNCVYPVLLWYYIGGLCGGLIYIFIYGFSKKSIHLAWNITFGCFAMGLMCNAFVMQSNWLAIIFAVFLGIGSTIGMINMYYILGVIGKKYNNLRYLKISIIFIGICGGISGVIMGNIINRINTFEISIFASIISVAIMLIFLIMSPVLSQTLYGDEWVTDSGKIEIDNEHLYIFRKYYLSKREIEVCKLLLQGFTLRQVSAMLSIAYPTVNTYCTSIYRKLEINSRTELLIIFKEYAMK